MNNPVKRKEVMSNWLGRKNRGFSLTELMVSLIIFAVFASIAYGILSSGQRSWFTTESRIKTRQDLRRILNRIARELQQTGYDENGIAKFAISDGGGINNTDIITFSIPIICESGGVLINSNGDVANWGAPLNWGCSSSSCMDADDNCTTRDYQLIEYALDSNNRLRRIVKDPSGNIVAEDIIAENIVDFQLMQESFRIISITLTAQRAIPYENPFTLSATMKVYLRN